MFVPLWLLAIFFVAFVLFFVYQDHDLNLKFWSFFGPKEGEQPALRND
jgi:hypothetical protein